MKNNNNNILDNATIIVKFIDIQLKYIIQITIFFIKKYNIIIND